MATSYNSKIVTDGLVLCLDAANPKSYSPNVHPNPTDIYGWVNTSVGNNCTLSRDTITSPVGTTPLKMVITGSDPSTPTYNSAAWNLLPAVSGQTWTVSVWVKGSVATVCELFIMEANSSGGYLVSGTSAFNVTTSWTRISYTYTLVNVSTTNLQIRLDGTHTGGTGVTIWWDGLQVERSSSITTFNSKTNTNGTNWFDQSGNAINGTLTNGPTYSSANGGSLVFDGIDDYAEFSGLQGNFTVGTLECWVKPTASDTFFQIVSRTNNSIAGNFNITKEVNNTYRFILRVTGTQYNIYTGISTTPTAWAHLVATYDGITQRFYFNSVLQLTENSVSGVVDTSVPYVQNIGRNTTGTGIANAQIPVVKIYNRALSNGEVSQNFNALRGRFGI